MHDDCCADRGTRLAPQVIQLAARGLTVKTDVHVDPFALGFTVAVVPQLIAEAIGSQVQGIDHGGDPIGFERLHANGSHSFQFPKADDRATC